jgi:hypothetical protein
VSDPSPVVASHYGEFTVVQKTASETRVVGFETQRELTEWGLAHLATFQIVQTLIARGLDQLSKENLVKLLDAVNGEIDSRALARMRGETLIPGADPHPPTRHFANPPKRNWIP